MKEGYLIREIGEPITCKYEQHRGAVSGEISGDFNYGMLKQARIQHFQLEDGTLLKIIGTGSMSGNRTGCSDGQFVWTFEFQVEAE